MKTINRIIACTLLTSNMLGIAGQPASEEMIASKIVAETGAQYRYELRQKTFAQRIEFKTNAIVHNGFLIELTRGPAKESPPERDGTNLVWSMFFTKGIDPREKWTGDFVAGRTPDEMFLVVSSGTSFGLFKTNPSRSATKVPDKIVSEDKLTADSSATWLARPSSEMLVTMPQIEQIHLAIAADLIVVNVLSPERRAKQYKFSITENRWM